MKKWILGLSTVFILTACDEESTIFEPYELYPANKGQVKFFNRIQTDCDLYINGSYVKSMTDYYYLQYDCTDDPYSDSGHKTYMKKGTYSYQVINSSNGSLLKNGTFTVNDMECTAVNINP